jgi:hypothetical protein
MARKIDWASKVADRIVDQSEGFFKDMHPDFYETAIASALRRAYKKGFGAALRAAVEVNNGS